VKRNKETKLHNFSGQTAKTGFFFLYFRSTYIKIKLLEKKKLNHNPMNEFAISLTNQTFCRK
jgi:hypothetical protein